LGDFHFKLHPLTLGGVLREDEDEFVMLLDYFNECWKYPVSWLHFKRSKSTEYATCFQISFQNLGKDSIFTGIAYKADEILNGIVDERVCVSDEGLGHASSAEKTLWNDSSRAQIVFVPTVDGP
jgi:hypothetical protein